MYARVTLFEIDTLRVGLDDALDRFHEMVLPELQQQPGYRGVYVMRTAEGKGLVMSLWETERDAMHGIESGFHEQQLAKFVSVFRSPPGRDHYHVVVADLLSTVSP